MQGSYSVAGGVADITPLTPVALAGYASVRKPVFDRVDTPLEANVVVLRDGGRTCVFIAVDLMYVGSRIRDIVQQGLSGRVPAESVFMSASHTHFGPPTEDSLPVLGAVNSEYVEFVAHRILGLAMTLLDGPFDAVAAEYCEGESWHSINRRRRVFGVSPRFPFIGSRIQISPNLAGPRDDVIRVLRIRDASGRDRAICWGFACHPVAYPAVDDLTAEYPGVVRGMLRARFGDMPIVFWQGFSGNIRPRVPAGAGGGMDPRSAPTFDPLSRAQWDDWSRSLGERVIDVAGRSGNPLAGPVSCTVRELDVSALGLSSAGKRLGFQEIRFGSALAICGLTAEVAVEYVDLLRRSRAPARVVPVGCVGDVFGYLPAGSMVGEGGYEVRGFVPRFGLGGGFSTDVSEIVTSRLFKT